MIRILLINPNASQATTEMMVAIAQAVAPSGVEVVGATATRSPIMILGPQALLAAAAEVAEIGTNLAPGFDGIIVSAFGDPGIDRLRQQVDIPVVGIAESGMFEAAGTSRRFGVATVTPELVEPIQAHATALGLGHLYTGIRLTPGDPLELAADPDRLVEALGEAVARCIQDDHTEAVVIGGGPLGNAATVLAPRFNVPVIAPIPAAMRRLMTMLA